AFLGRKLTLIAFFGQLLYSGLDDIVHPQSHQRAGSFQSKATAYRFQHLVQDRAAISISHRESIVAPRGNATSPSQKLARCRNNHASRIERSTRQDRFNPQVQARTESRAFLLKPGKNSTI